MTLMTSPYSHGYAPCDVELLHEGGAGGKLRRRGHCIANTIRRLCGTPEGHQEQDPGSWSHVSCLRSATVRLLVFCRCPKLTRHVCREESEKVSELKSVSGSGKLPYGTLALGAEGIKDAISGFEDA